MREHREYCDLINYMYTVPFTYIIPSDVNRIKDANEFYSRYMYEYFSDEELNEDEDRFISVLEVLVALSVRVETDITGEPGNDSIDRWFWIMIRNLGLDEYSDDVFDEAEVYDILMVFMDRKYDRYGFGGLFPLENTVNDQRKVGIWEQFMEYLNENLDIF